MKINSFFIAATIVIIMSSCQDNNNSADKSSDPDNTGTEQVQPPVLNSGIETERTRAEEAVGKDSTNKETHVGKDEKGAVPTDSSK